MQKTPSKTDWAKVDITTDEELTRQAKADGTMLTDEQLTNTKPIADFPELQTVLKRGRPRKTNPKQPTTIRLDTEVIGFFKSYGKGWQTEINDVLRNYVNKQEHKTEHRA